MKTDCPHCKSIQPIPSTHGNNACVRNLNDKLRRVRRVYWKVPGREGQWKRLDAWRIAKILGVKPTRVLVFRKAS